MQESWPGNPNAEHPKIRPRPASLGGSQLRNLRVLLTLDRAVASLRLEASETRKLENYEIHAEIHDYAAAGEVFRGVP